MSLFLHQLRVKVGPVTYMPSMNYVHAMLQFNPRAGKKHSN